jgi:hypothetical protein
MLINFSLWLYAFWPLSAALLAFLLFSFWSDWRSFFGKYLITWISLVVPLLSLYVGAYWWHKYAGRGIENQNTGNQIIWALLGFFLLIWMVLLLTLKLPFDRRLLSLFLIQAYLTAFANVTAYLGLMPLKPYLKDPTQKLRNDQG